MEWNVKNAQNRDVERQHLNKILKEIRGNYTDLSGRIGNLGTDLSQTQKEINTTVIRIINNEIPPERLITKVTLDGDVTGTSVVVPGQNAVTITTQLQGDFLSDAPNDNNAYWRRAGQWEAVPDSLYYITEITGSGYAVWNEDELVWTTNQIDSADDSRIIVTNGDGIAGPTTIDLAEVVPLSVGTLQLTRFDEYGRRDGEAPATTDNLAEGTTNLYWKEAPSDGQIYGRQDETWVPIIASSGGFVPFFIPDGQVFTVPMYQQALYSQEIILDGTGMIVLEGILLEVD